MSLKKETKPRNQTKIADKLESIKRSLKDSLKANESKVVAFIDVTFNLKGGSCYLYISQSAGAVEYMNCIAAER